MKKCFLATAFVCLAASPSFSKELWDCTFSNKNAGWVSDKLAVVVDDNGTAQVIDGLLIHFKQSPAAATVYRNDDRILGVRWVLKNTRDDRGQGANKLDYELRFNKQRNRAVLDVRPHGFPNSFNGRGTCKIRKP